VNDAESAGRLLAARHAIPAPPEPERSLVNYAESPRRDDWTLRSALVRLAQPEPERVGAVLELIRRCDGALHPLARALERHTVSTEPALNVAALDDSAADERAPSDGIQPDCRAADLARVGRDRPAELTAILAAYDATAETPLSDEERAAIPLLVVVLGLDELGELLADWAAAGARDAPPLDRFDAICAEAFASLERLGVAREEPPNGLGRRPRQR